MVSTCFTETEHHSGQNCELFVVVVFLKSFSLNLVAFFLFLSASLQCYFCDTASDLKLHFASVSIICDIR